MRAMTRHFLIIGGLATAVVIAAAVIAPRAAHGASPTRSVAQNHLPGGQCFRSADVRSWTAPDPRTLYLRVLVNHYYRVDLARECPPLRWHDAMLVTGTTGSPWVCSPLDWSVSASSWPGDIPQTCFVQNITRLTADEAAALPKGAKP
jgi:hypothetical protein